LGIAFLFWAFFDGRFRDAEGFLKGDVCLPFSFAIALILASLTVSRSWRKFGFWFGLGLVGQAVALQTIDAGPIVRYQHYRPFMRLVSESNPFLLVFIAGQTFSVIAAFRLRWPEIRRGLGQSFGRFHILAIGLLFFGTSATLSREISVYIAELFFAALVQLINLGNVVLIVWTIPDKSLSIINQKLAAIFGQRGDRQLKYVGFLDRFALLTALWVALLATVLSLTVYQRHPHLADEAVYLIHARYLASGTLTSPAPPVPDAFDLDLMELDGDRWYPAPPPGWPGMLALGVLLGVPWLVNPLLAFLNILLSYILLGKLYDRVTAKLAVFLISVSPWHIFMAMNFMSHTFTLTCALLAALGILKARESGNIIWAGISGIATGAMSLIRPLNGLILAGLLGLWAIGLGGRRLNFRSIAALVCATLIVGALVLPYNKALTGKVGVFPIMAYTDKHFGP
jgi:hypothetical protein